MSEAEPIREAGELGSAAQRAPARGRRPSTMQSLRAGAGAATSKTLADVVLERTGSNFIKSTQIMSYVAMFGLFVDHVGREPKSTNELAAAMKSKRSRATVDRWARTFREAFPEYAMPSVLWAIASDQVETRDEEKLTLLLPSVRIVEP